MNIHRHLFPASIAAAFHAALLWLLPVGPMPPATTLIEIPLPPWPPKPDEPATPPTEKEGEEEPMRSLAGGPTPPELPEDLVPRKTDGPTIPIDSRPGNPTKDTKIIPEKFGPGDGVGSIGTPGVPVFPADQLDRTPSAKVRIAPEYPATLRHSGAEGSVVVEFAVDRSGRVTSARVLRSTHREFEETTLRAVLKWRFEPGRRNGVAVPFRMQVPVDFHIE